MGGVTLRRFATIDNGNAGIDVESVEEKVPYGINRLEDSIIVGRSENWDGGEMNPLGVITPRTERWSMSNVRFYNFDWGTTASIGTCSHCKDTYTHTDAITVYMEQLAFDNVTMRVRYGAPYKTIISDLDGTFTGLGANTWASAFWTHNAA